VIKVQDGKRSIEEMRLLCRKQLLKMDQRINAPVGELQATKMAKVNWLRTQPIARNSDKINQDVYESDIEIWKLRLGPALKFSAGHWPDPPVKHWSLAEAEVAMLEMYIERAQIRDGMDILDLGSELRKTS
jgi:hypothetical protein